MMLRKITNDNTVNHIAENEKIQSLSRERDNKPNTIKNDSLLKKQNKFVSQNNKNFIKGTIKRDGFRIHRWMKKCYF